MRPMYGLPFIKPDGSRANFYQDFVVLGNGLFDVLDLDDVRRGPVSAIDGGFHVSLSDQRIHNWSAEYEARPCFYSKEY